MLLFSTLMFAAIWAAHAADVSNHYEYSCYDNQTNCVADLREILVSEDKFWFGSSYGTDCPNDAPSSPACNNPDRFHKSLLSRLLNTTEAAELNQASQTISLAHVNFTSPEGHIFACGHNFHIPAESDHRIDPLHITRVSSWSLSHVPTVTWTPTNDSTSYTVVVWDVGNFYLHALYINSKNGSMVTGQVVKEYGGPRNPFLREDAYLFLVYEQNATLDVDVVKQLLDRSFGQNGGRFHPGVLFATFSSSIKNKPSFANLMTVVGDPYSIQAQKDAFLVNNCPYLLSQLAAFHTVIEGTNISVSWSNNKTNSSLDVITPYLTTLRVSIDVEYSTDDFSVESCCSQYSLTRGLFRPDPFNVNTERPGMARSTPQVRFSPIDIISRTGISGDTYTLFLLDVAPALMGGAPNTTFITHWLVTNIRNSDVSIGDELAPYFGPNPSTPNIARVYMFLLVRQPVSKLNNSVLAEFCPTGGQRCRLRLKPIMEAWNLRDIVGLTWFQAELDGFSRYRVYDVLKTRTKSDVCKGVPGYGDPCPKPCTDASCQSSYSALLHIVLVTFAIFIQFSK